MQFPTAVELVRAPDILCSLPSDQLFLPTPVLPYNQITLLFLLFQDLSVENLALMKNNTLKMTKSGDNCF